MSSHATPLHLFSIDSAKAAKAAKASPDTPAPLIERITTRYSPTQDRMAMAGDLPGSLPVVLWLSQRLLLRLLPRLFQWLQLQSAADVKLAHGAAEQSALAVHAVQRFAQEAAAQQLTAQPPVHTPVHTPQALVEAVSIGQSALWIHLEFQGVGDALPVAMVLSAPALRQWLVIVQRQWREAQWPVDVWPGWLVEAADGPPSEMPASVH